MSVPAHAIELDIEVPFHDCDPLFVVWHGRYFQYMQMAHTALFRSRKLDVPDLIDMGYRMYVTDTRCRYTFPLAFGDTLRIKCWFAVQTPLIRVAYTLLNVTKRRASARAYTVTATTDRAGKLLSTTPDDILERLPR